jgi:hypothetical protein
VFNTSTAHQPIRVFVMATLFALVVLICFSAASARASVYLGHTGQIAFHDANGEMWVWETPSYSNEGGLTRKAGGAMQAGTSPSISGYEAGASESIQAAFEGADNNLYRWQWGGYIGTGLAMAPSSIPSVGYVSGGYAIAFRNSAGRLEITGTGGTSEYGLGIAAGTNPTIIPWPTGWVVAFAAAGTNKLYVFYTASGTGTEYGLTIASGSSPAINWSGGGEWEAAFRAAGTGNLYLYSPWRGNTELGLGVAPKTNPSVWPVSSGRWKIAFNGAGSDDLWLYDTSTGGLNTGLGMAAGTSPSLTRRSTGAFEAAFTANTNDLFQYNEAIGDRDSGFRVEAGTSPSDFPVG